MEDPLAIGYTYNIYFNAVILFNHFRRTLTRFLFQEFVKENKRLLLIRDLPEMQ